MLRSTLLLLSVAVPAALLVACGSDTTSGTTSGGGEAPATTSATGTGSGGSSSTGTGSGGSASTSTSATSGTGTSTGTGTMAMGACTNMADLAIVNAKDVKKITEDCGKANITNEDKMRACIKMGTNLSDPCVTCFGDTVTCVIKNCINDCIADSGSPACTACRAMKCDPAFETCSGLPSK